MTRLSRARFRIPRYLWIITIVLAAIAFTATQVLRPKKSERTTVVKTGDLIQRITIAGAVEANRSTIVTAPYEGYVRKLYVELGQKVPKDAPLVSISQTLSQVEQSFPIRSPFAGKIVQVLKTEGQFVRPSNVSDAILRLDDLSKLYVQAAVPEIDFVKIKSEMEATIRASAILTRSYRGILRDIAQAASTKDGWRGSSQVEFGVKLEVLDPDDSLKPGMSVLVDIITGKKEGVLTVGHEFILQQGEEYFVFLKNGEKRAIRIGLQNESSAEVASGLQEGDEVRQIDFVQMLKESNRRAK